MAMENQSSGAESLSFVCSSCGGTMVFSPETETLTCQYCGQQRDIEIPCGEIEENDFDYWVAQKHSGEEAAAREGEPVAGPDDRETETTSEPGAGGVEGADSRESEVLQITCTQCGATTTFSPNTASQNCPFCSSPLMASEAHVASFWEPNYVVPFSVSQKRCGELFGKWAKAAYFAPNAFRRLTMGSRRFSGVYLPYWTYDADTVGHYTGRRGTVYTERDSDGKERSRVSWTYVSGDVSESFDDVLVPAVDNLPRKVLQQVIDWDQASYKKYTREYMAGFETQIYTVDFEAGYAYALETMRKTLKDLVERDIGGDQQQVLSLEMDVSNRKFKLLLLPIWTTACRYKGKVYQVVINGRSGKVYGQKPVSWIKVLLAIIAACGLLYLLYMGLNAL